MARLRRKDLKNVTVLHPWGAPRLDLTAVFCPETSTSDFFFFRRRNQTFILEDKLNVFFDRANNWLLREKRFYGATLFYLFRGRNRVYIDYFPIPHNTLCLPPKFCITYCLKMLMGKCNTPRSI